MGTKTSYALAALVAGGLGYWMYSGELVMGGQGDDPDSLPPPAERAMASEEAPMAVRVREVTASMRENALQVRGRAEASTRVQVRSETSGQVTEINVVKGQRVAAGDPLCRIDQGAREAQLSQAEAQLRQAQFDYDNNVTLAERGVVAEARVRSARATLDAAKAAVAQAEQEIGRVAVTAPIAGVIEDPLAELGDVLAAGDVCAAIVQTDPMLAIGQVSERDIALLEEGMDASVAPVGGEPKFGRITYIAPTAEAATRTFRVEVSVPNEDGLLRDGMTSNVTIPLPATRAHELTASTLTLNDEGVIGVRTVDDEGTVVFMPVTILADSRDGVWVTGLPETVNVITVGQEYVAHGSKVQAVPDERDMAAADANEPAPIEDAPAAAPDSDADLAPAAQASSPEPTEQAAGEPVEPADADAALTPVTQLRTRPQDGRADPTAEPASGDELRRTDIPPAPEPRPAAEGDVSVAAAR